MGLRSKVAEIEIGSKYKYYKIQDKSETIKKVLRSDLSTTALLEVCKDVSKLLKFRILLTTL